MTGGTSARPTRSGASAPSRLPSSPRQSWRSTRSTRSTTGLSLAPTRATRSPRSRGAGAGRSHRSTACGSRSPSFRSRRAPRPTPSAARRGTSPCGAAAAPRRRSCCCWLWVRRRPSRRGCSCSRPPPPGSRTCSSRATASWRRCRGRALRSSTLPPTCRPTPPTRRGWCGCGGRWCGGWWSTGTASSPPRRRRTSSPTLSMRCTAMPTSRR
mmetsp:Transcript_18146/g.57983  ORF Transcript_18146/g.57983 Transcript_18146/m.57983 type:complete len:212 (+) Transcript_18146:73-708(+)